MTDVEHKELEEAVTDLVLQILQRGRLNQQELEGKIGVRDMSVNTAKLRYVQQIMSLAKTEAISLADKIIGPDVELNPTVDLQEGDLIPDYTGEAINAVKSVQRLALAEYQNGPAPQATLAEEKDLTEMERVDPNKPTMELVGVPGTDQLSENEA